MKDEIVSGLKNAMARGSSLEKAVQSFLNAGYNPKEVREAGELLSSGASEIVYPKEQQDKEDAPSPPSLEKKKGNKTLLIIAIIFVLLIFLGALGYLIYTFAIK